MRVVRTSDSEEGNSDSAPPAKSERPVARVSLADVQVPLCVQEAFGRERVWVRVESWVASEGPISVRRRSRGVVVSGPAHRK